MQSEIKYYQPGQIITLFDATKSEKIFGSLVFRQRKVAKKRIYYKALKKDFSKYRYFEGNVPRTKDISKKSDLGELFGDINRQFLEWDGLIYRFVSNFGNNLRSLLRVKLWYPQLAVALLLFSFASLLTVLLPIFASSINFSNSPTPTPVSKIIEKTWSGESLAEFNARDQREREKMSIKDFRVVIPKINIDSNIIPYVDSTNEGEYKEQLMSGVAHAKGSYLPYEAGPMYLFSHSTDSIFNIVQYNAKFYALKDLEEGDELSVILNEKEYKYKVKTKEIINPDQIDLIHQTQADLILQTCWPPGTDWQRLVVFAEKIK